ncbi:MULTISPECIES: hypothetical protein [Sphingomonas]|jgi:hypothetical protein|uniref:hypothetical protein n=2 Tax=Sphingomonadaceae TaxID=41297 RepID=UPI0006F8C0D3|nr:MULTISPECIES: hypothetical protein [Sphingomonas]KQN21074.1 hypothetical protein ASE89_16765 [Sphingomonas sp. Leaf30]MBD8550615.1 hypothetical protein [Sphingomonas sp. CFBP 8764]MBD8638597.1 hypothetical protein [Sphingomonas sp. CFBP 13733]MDY0967258.1 hypothetical protein [Sphingomonas sp. CFBP9021]MDY1006653.1 hypothetical protein [Sphingomonas sp. CFBP9019]
MSSIPNSAMPHAKVKHDDDAAPAPAAKGDWMDDATDAAKAGIATATDAVKSHPKTAIAVGATLVAGIAAAIAAPALRAKDAPEKKTPPKPAPKKPGKPKKAH